MENSLQISVILPHIPFQSGGTLSKTRFLGARSLILKPLSAMIESPGSNRSRKPLCSVICLLLEFPVHNLETNVKIPSGDIPTGALMVLCCL